MVEKERYNRWHYDEVIEKQWLPIIKNWLPLPDNEEDDEHFENKLDLSGTDLNPFILWQMLESLGYVKKDIDDNGWEQDFWVTFEKKIKEEDFQLQIEATEMTFEMSLCKLY